MNRQHDKVTGILDITELNKALSSQESISCFLINIDNFSNINSAYGYEVGNRVLRESAHYLNIIKPQKSTLYRLCSDKFILLDKRSRSDDELSKIAELILSFFSISDIIIDDELEFKISLSIGISRGVGTLNITQAELAIRELRRSKRNHYNLFKGDSEFMRNQQKNIYWIQKIGEAIINEEVLAYYQPIINNMTGEIEKFETLARLKDDDEIISPFIFLEAAKITGNLSYITKSLIAQSFAKFSGTEYEFSINITGEDLLQEYLESSLLKYSKRYNIAPSRVVLEMLEDIASLGSATILKQLHSLREYGFKVAIDDFGAENSNLSRLLEIEPDYLKIDGAFIKNIVSDKKSQIIVDAIVSICKQSGIKIIAEYIHDEEVQKRVKELGIEYSQGYYFGAPSSELLVL